MRGGRGCVFFPIIPSHCVNHHHHRAPSIAAAVNPVSLCQRCRNLQADKSPSTSDTKTSQVVLAQSGRQYVDCIPFGLDKAHTPLVKEILAQCIITSTACFIHRREAPNGGLIAGPLEVLAAAFYLDSLINVHGFQQILTLRITTHEARRHVTAKVSEFEELHLLLHDCGDLILNLVIWDNFIFLLRARALLGALFGALHGISSVSCSCHLSSLRSRQRFVRISGRLYGLRSCRRAGSRWWRRCYFRRLLRD
mmetsp:Transcript_99024/g.186031  ORF Transcript_99024/g.186031 Transcript_99024/m.186031 type:complete len:252 (+) Transcript_99024:1-756(+)